MPPLPLTGTWQMIRAELAGEAAPDMVVDHTVLEITATGYGVRFQGQEMDCGLCELGGTADQATLILHGRKGPNAGRTIPCIYQLRGDRLRVCYGMDGIAPTEYATDARNGRFLATYRRV